MNTNTLEVKVTLQIQKSTHEVFEAVVDPEKMKNYFISYGSGRMLEGKEIIWRFPEFDDDAPVRVGKIEENKYISFYWHIEDKELLVEIKIEAQNDGSTVVYISEKSMENNATGIQWLRGNTEGWANFLACLKAWLEYGIHLRKGAFDFMRNI